MKQVRVVDILVGVYQYQMSLFSRSQTLHHFKILFPVPLEKIQNCLKKLQLLQGTNTSAVCISLNGHPESPESCQLLHEALLDLRERNRLSVFAFLEDKATALTYFTATAAQTVTANPFSLIGDIGSTQKSYRNVKRLMDLIGIKYSELGGKGDCTQLWNQFTEKSEREREITNKWLAVVEKNMLHSVALRRNIPHEEALAIKNRVFHPREALRARLIDSVSTFEEFRALNYPNHAVENVVYRLDGTRIHHSFTLKELSAISALLEIAELPSVTLLSSENLFLSALTDLFQLLQARLQSDTSLDQLDLFLAHAFATIQGETGQGNLAF